MDFLHGFSEMLEDIEHFVHTNHHHHDMVELFVNSNEFSNDGVSVPLHRVEDLNMDTVFMEVEKVSQSNKGLGLDDESFTVEVVLVNMPRGGGYESRYLLHLFGQDTRHFEKYTGSVLSTSGLSSILCRRLLDFCRRISSTWWKNAQTNNSRKGERNRTG